MRVIIESTEQGSGETPIYELTQISNVETTDGGAPSEELIQSIAEALPVSVEKEGIDAGSPPEWLLVTIQGVTQPCIEETSADTDAGSSPAVKNRTG